MKRIKLVVAYDGTNYCGWQVQPNGITIEGVLNEALSNLLKEEIQVTGASRTDSGVHSMGNVAIFDTETRIPPEKICYALNQRLPDDIVVQESCEVPGDWHPRHCSSRKTYEYRILNKTFPMPTRRLDTYFVYRKIDLGKMQAAADYLVGTHDFKSFCSAGSPVEDTVRTIYSCQVEKADDIITIRVTGSGFLYNMVRIIAGTLLQVGMGYLGPEDMTGIIAAKNREAAGPTAPAHGLTMIGIVYEDTLLTTLSLENEKWSCQMIRTEIPTKGKVYVLIDRCEDHAFSELITEMVERGKRYGGQFVYFCDREKEGRMQVGCPVGGYSPCDSNEFYIMEKDLVDMDNGEGYDSDEQRQGGVSCVSVRKEEIPEFCEFANEVFYPVPNSSTHTCQELMEYFADSTKELLWLVYGNQRVGFLFLSQDGDKMEVEEIGIENQYRKKGIARRALILAEEIAKEKGIYKMNLLVAERNLPAKTLYKKVGYEIKRIRSRWYEIQLKKCKKMVDTEEPV